MTIPCIDCLIFPICLNQYRELRIKDIKNKYEYPAMSKTVARNELRIKCKILDEYLESKIGDKTVYTKSKMFSEIFERKEWR